MNYNDEESLQNWDDNAETNKTPVQDNINNATANAYRVDSDDEVTEKDLTRSFLGDAERNEVREGQPMGGHSFGKSNVTPSGDDKNNPSQNAGYSNAYFARTEPSEEHPENSNFTPDGNNMHQEGTADNDGQYQNAEEGPIDIRDRERFGLDNEFENRRDIEPK
ncbi:hypothetical protein [Mucilaginibacter auburnensis]|uniref:Uncharacterized protein n=1 Tax=Mucilaginibacter auburnensis TaxID=1457233 RepID=A0A2H9VMF6_9SPHI|nr:hypothetical protein [Mucilaginibacter auburnensis]PJJ79494.1 hypothetical protein CLV57_2628 [Mucilaginibacter auburnensis]